MSFDVSDSFSNLLAYVSHLGLLLPVHMFLLDEGLELLVLAVDRFFSVRCRHK